jgi:hypothetical protein
MTSEANDAINKAIRTAAITKGYADAMVVPQHIQKRKDNELEAGSWLVLSVKRQAGGDWEIRGRRRTAAELSQLL